jgi:hypothetical protein
VLATLIVVLENTVRVALLEPRGGTRAHLLGRWDHSVVIYDNDLE